jgi:hypothetical protein
MQELPKYLYRVSIRNTDQPDRLVRPIYTIATDKDQAEIQVKGAINQYCHIIKVAKLGNDTTVGQIELGLILSK